MDHAVDAGSVRFHFGVSEPTVTHIPAVKLEAGEPTITIRLISEISTAIAPGVVYPSWKDSISIDDFILYCEILNDPDIDDVRTFAYTREQRLYVDDTRVIIYSVDSMGGLRIHDDQPFSVPLR